MEAAQRIGLIPNVAQSAKVVQVGNAAIEGASIALLSKTKRQEFEERWWEEWSTAASKPTRDSSISSWRDASSKPVESMPWLTMNRPAR